MQSSKQQSTGTDNFNKSLIRIKFNVDFTFSNVGLVRHWIYTTMGIFAERFPEHMVAHSDRLMSSFINILKSEVLMK